VSVYEKIAQLGITLPEVTPPVAAFVPFVRSGNQIFVSGHIAKENGKPWVGQLGLNITTELGIRAARSVAIDLMATLNLAVGDLNNIRRIIKLMCLVNSAPTFTEQHTGRPAENNVQFGCFSRVFRVDGREYGPSREYA
jgi:enamine deaminase RidA (YjgF/YER057c/UK114 family)